MSALRPFDLAHWTAHSPIRLEALRRALADPPLTLTPPALAALFEVNRLRVVARRPADLQDYPELPVRVRGAVGRVLAALGPPIVNRHDPFARPRAWDVLFEPMSAPASRAPIAKPLVVHARVEAQSVLASASVFGLAGFWAPDAGAALVGALEGGVTLWEQGKTKASFPCLEAKSERQCGFDPPRLAVREARLRFRSPLRLRKGDSLATSEASFPIALANRAARLAPWVGARLAVDWGEVHRRARSIDVDYSDLRPYFWSRGTQRAHRRLPVLGLLGTLVMRGNLDFWTPFLQIAEAANAGAHASIGLGAFDLTLLP
jgi:hypothetical protein